MGSHFREQEDSVPTFVSITPEIRKALGSAIEGLIALLDELEGDTDQERDDEGDDDPDAEEDDPGEESDHGGGDILDEPHDPEHDEPTLGWTVQGQHGFNSIGEAEPSLGWTADYQPGGGANGQYLFDCEGEHDGREPEHDLCVTDQGHDEDADREPSLGWSSVGQQPGPTGIGLQRFPQHRASRPEPPRPQAALKIDYGTGHMIGPDGECWRVTAIK